MTRPRQPRTCSHVVIVVNVVITASDCIVIVVIVIAMIVVVNVVTDCSKCSDHLSLFLRCCECSDKMMAGWKVYNCGSICQLSTK